VAARRIADSKFEIVFNAGKRGHVTRLFALTRPGRWAKNPRQTESAFIAAEKSDDERSPDRHLE